METGSHNNRLFIAFPREHWKPIPLEEIPAVRRLPKEEQLWYAQKLRIPLHKAETIQLVICLSMPEHPYSIQYMHWLKETNQMTHPTFGIMIENKDTWERAYGTDKAREFVRSMIAHGRPPCNWSYVPQPVEEL